MPATAYNYNKYMDIITLIGSAAAALTTISFLPQVARIWRTKHTHDLALATYIIFALGVSLWFCYGVMIRSVPIMAANGITFVLAIYIVAMKVKYR